MRINNAPKVDLVVTKGRTANIVIGLTDIEGNDYTLKSDEKLIFGVKLNTESTECIIKKELTSADKVADGYLLNLSATELDIQAMNYKYDVALKTADGLYSVIACSEFKVVESVVNGSE